MSRRNEKYFTGAEWCDNCYLYIFGYGKKRGKQCDFSCIGTPFPCRYYISAYWKMMRFYHYHKKKPKFPTTLEAWKNRVKLPF